MEISFPCEVLWKPPSNDGRNTSELELFAIESYAKEIDDHLDKELLKKLILDHAEVARSLEKTLYALSLSEARLKEANRIALLGYWDIDHRRATRHWSESLYEILETDPSEAPSIDLLLKRVHPDDREMVLEIRKGLTENNNDVAMTRYRLLMEDGRIKWVSLIFRTERDVDGRPILSRGTIQDITKIKIAEDKLEEYSKHLEAMVVEKVREISESQMATIFALVKLSESRDDDTGAHIERTASFCRLLASKAMHHTNYSGEIGKKFLETIYKASPLHDIGKVGIPDSILLKPGKLTDEEFAQMKQHVIIGYRTIAEIEKQYKNNEFLRMGMEICRYHHEKWNGTGYPEGISGDDIPLSARIMAIADVYDALRSKRVYKEAFSHEKSREIIVSSKGTHFDPLLVDFFAETEKEFEQLYFDLT